MFSLHDNTEQENYTSLKEEDPAQKDPNSFQKLKTELSKNQQEILDLRKEITSLKDVNSRLRKKIINLLSLIQEYKTKEAQLLVTEENLKNMRNEYDSLKDSLLRDRANFRSELRLKDNIYNQDIIQTNLRTESLKHQVDNFTGIKKLNDILYIKNNELKKLSENKYIKEKSIEDKGKDNKYNISNSSCNDESEKEEINELETITKSILPKSYNKHKKNIFFKNRME